MSAGAHFSSIRSGFDFNTHSYGSKVTLGRLSTCEISGDEAQAEFECLEEFAEAPDAKAVFSMMARSLEVCLAGNARKGNMSDNARRYTYSQTDDDIELHLRRLPRSGVYQVVLSITFIDPSK
ncbi:hypothetical protein GCM10007890_10490 [Methylobacterium tardum]|uniref:Uncharacterized protein n=1 Tax=Methylobacterium tardum TaxID=374432 RepID=A0AA37TBQ7_9HYPH|nr:hypothetical protein GCM10007890_10490 [Methylobacterium tardum]